MSTPQHEPVPTDLHLRRRTALTLFESGQYAAAERAWQELAQDCEQELGRHHPATIGALDRLGSALFRLRRLPESADRHLDAHGRAVAAYGHNDPETLRCAHNLGCALAVAQRWDEGLPVLRDTLVRRARELGPGHVETLATAKTLGVSLYLSGDPHAATELLEPTYQRARRTFGQDDPLVQDIRRNLDVVLRNVRRT